MVKLRADFDKFESVPFDAEGWVPSPAGGVDRFMLDRIGDEVARATTIVRYEPESRFPMHQHDQGEEFLVLEGVFSDSSGDYPPGAYVRNPPGTQHAPWTDEGCIIFVKLRQFMPDDLEPVVHQLQASSEPEKTTSLHRYQDEIVDTVALATGRCLTWDVPEGGCEMLVLEGSARVNDERCDKWHWLRFPAGHTVTVEGPCHLYRKQGHLPPS